ncbi:MAG: carboxymuconolactone decarboxylase family protein, partial [Ferruginibacter sp.]
MQLLLAIEQYINKSGMDKKLLQLIKVRTSQINSCAYCLDMYMKEAI